MHTIVDAPGCRKRAQPTHRLEQVCRRWLQRDPGGTSRDRPSVELAANLGEGDSQSGLEASKAEEKAPEPGASVPLPLVSKVAL